MNRELSYSGLRMFVALTASFCKTRRQETSANLRPDPVLSWDTRFLPIFDPGKSSEDYINTVAQFRAAARRRRNTMRWPQSWQ